MFVCAAMQTPQL